MDRPLAMFLCLLGAAALAPACAEGESGTDSDVSAASAGDAGPAEAPTCPSPCPADHVCSAGQCVPASTDADGDGVPASLDCDDRDPDVRPGAIEVCNGKDDDCNGKVDDGFDADGDGFPICATPGKPADCDDADPAVNPGAAEVCNGKDDDCDGVIDDGFDKDNDGFYSCVRGTLPADCDDTDSKINPSASEVCNGKDDDCDGKIDELPALLQGSTTPPVDPHWVLAGSAAFGGGWVQLTPDSNDKAGALWWNAPYLFDTFEVDATFWIQNKAGADGMAFAWVPGNNNVVGGGASAYGAGLLGGYAIAIDTYANTGEPAPPFLVIMNGANNAHLARQALPNVRDSANHSLKVKLAAGKVSVWIDGINYFFDFPLPGYAPFTGRWGFTAATGGLSEAHWVRDITMRFPEGQGCVP